MFYRRACIRGYSDAGSVCNYDRIPMTCFKQNHARMGDNATRSTQASHAVKAEGARPGPPRYRDNSVHPDYQSAALQTLVLGRCNGVALEQYMNGIDTARQHLGNRAFMHRVGTLRAAGMEPGTREEDAGQAHELNTLLQFMPKKRKKKAMAADAEPGVLTEAPPGTATPDMPGPSPDTPSGVGTQAAPDAAPELPPKGEEETTAVGGKKQKKKSRVQVALKTLRDVGVEAFKDFLEARVDETALLDTLTERAQRAQNLADVRDAALDAVQARLRTLDPMAVADVPQAPVQVPEQVVEGAVILPVKTSPTYKETVLFESCLRGDARTLASLLRFGKANINVMTPGGTLLYMAAEKNYRAVVNILLSRPGINVNLANSIGATPLFAAAQYGHLEVARMLLQQPKINPSIGTSNNGTTPLTVAACFGHEEMVELLLSSGNIKINLRQKDGATALFGAVQKNRPKVVKLLISKGADVNLPLWEGTAPLCVAAFQGYNEVVELLVNTPGIQIDQSGADKATPLYYACYQEHKEIVRLLLNNGADPNTADQYGIPALNVACGAGNTKIVELLLNNKADPDIVDATGVAAIHIACVTGHTEILEMLLDAGADMDLKAKDEYAPYRVASIAGKQVVMNLLEARSRRPAGPAAQLESLSPAYHMQGRAPEDQAEQTTPNMTSTVVLPQTGAKSAGPARKSASTPETAQGGGAGAGAETDGKAQAVRKSGGSSQTATGSQPGATETRSPLERAKLDFREDILLRLKDERIDPLDGIRLLEAVNGIAALDGLCGIYNRLAGIERKKMRVRNRPLRRKFAVMRGEAKPHETSGFILGDKANLDAEAVEAEIRKYLTPAHHKFISQAVNDMEFGRGKPTSGYPDILHVSAGIPGVGSCSVFFYQEADPLMIRIAGIGHHLDRASYRLSYTAAELRGLRTLNLS